MVWGWLEAYVTKGCRFRFHVAYQVLIKAAILFAIKSRCLGNISNDCLIRVSIRPWPSLVLNAPHMDWVLMNACRQRWSPWEALSGDWQLPGGSTSSCVCLWILLGCRTPTSLLASLLWMVVGDKMMKVSCQRTMLWNLRCLLNKQTGVDVELCRYPTSCSLPSGDKGKVIQSQDCSSFYYNCQKKYSNKIPFSLYK